MAVVLREIILVLGFCLAAASGVRVAAGETKPISTTNLADPTGVQKRARFSSGLRCECTLDVPTGNTVAFSGDGSSLLVAGDRGINVFKSETLQHVFDREVDGGVISKSAISPSGDWVLVAHGPKLDAFSSKSKELTKRLNHHGRITSIAFAAKGARAVSSSEDGEVRIWDVKNWEMLNSRKHPLAALSAVFAAADGSRVLSVAEVDKRTSTASDTLAYIWDAESGRDIAPPTGIQTTNPEFRKEPWVRLAAVDGSGSRFAAYVLQDRVFTFSVAAGRRVARRVFGSPGTEIVQLSSDGRRLLTAGRGDTTRVWDEENPQIIALPALGKRAFAAGMSANGDRVVLALEGAAVVWDVAKDKRLLTLKGNGDDEVPAVALSEDGRRAIIGFKSMSETSIWTLPNN